MLEAGDLYNGRIVRIANGFVFKEPVFNYSGDFPFVWDEIVVPIKCDPRHGGRRSAGAQRDPRSRGRGAGIGPRITGVLGAWSSS
ncbi:MAG: hypothetical protein R3B70_12380 [Polyangiaceae bacterium]